MNRMLITRMIFGFAKWSKPKPAAVKFKEEKRAKALGDDKAAKLSKSEIENEIKKKKQQEEMIFEKTKKHMELIRKHDPALELDVPKSQLERLYNQQLIRIKGMLPKKKKILPPEPQKNYKPFRLPNELYEVDPTTNELKKAEIPLKNYLKDINAPFEGQIKEIKPTDGMRRVGVIGVKLGMTTLWDDWGRMVGVTAIELDRVQIVQIKQPQHTDGYYHVQVGCGQRNLKRINKPMIGHYMKARVPPKRYLAEFKVSKDCLLPIGYMMSARHYTPGMKVDVMGKTVGHGFTGTIKNYRFRRQPASHGNSVTTRVLGSTGCRQDPGRVFKMKKMYGRKGQDNTIQYCVKIFKIDVEKNILYLYGSVPGKAGTPIRIRDTTRYFPHQENMDIGHYPTFVEQPGKIYAKQFKMFVGERDPEEIDYNDNAYILDDKEEDPGLTATTPAAGAQMNLPED